MDVAIPQPTPPSFGAPNNIRFSYATSEDVIHKMLDRFKTILSLVK